MLLSDVISPCRNLFCISSFPNGSVAFITIVHNYLFLVFGANMTCIGYFDSYFMSGQKWQQK